jgi:hypothetical protein
MNSNKHRVIMIMGLYHSSLGQACRPRRINAFGTVPPRILVLVLPLFWAPLRLAAQEPVSSEPAALDTAQLIGQVVSAIDGRVIPGAVVSLLGSGMGAISDSSGNFRIPLTIAGTDTLEVRFVGYESGTVEVYLEPNRVTRLVLLLSPTTVRVAELNVEIERSETPALYTGFYRRKNRGIGHFITPEEIARRQPRYTTDMLRSVPGLAVGASRGGRAQVTVTRELRPCEPVIFLDGLYLADMAVDDILGTDLGAIEVYLGPSQVPAQYANLAPTSCGAILVWTRRGRAPRP